MKNRGLIIAGNWKMNHGPKEAAEFLQKLPQGSEGAKGLTAILFPPFLSLHAAHAAAQGRRISIGAQNAHHEKSGAFTGEISGPMLAELGIRDVLVGHSERRQFFGETDESAGARTAGLLAQGFRVMLCVGETKSEREGNLTGKVLTRQLAAGLPKSTAPFLDGRLTIAYEPVWAIGTGLTATPAQAEDAHQIIRKWLWDTFGMEASGRTPILYGGSVKPDNIEELLRLPNIDGALVGGASLKPDSFHSLLQSAQRVLATSP